MPRLSCRICMGRNPRRISRMQFLSNPGLKFRKGKRIRACAAKKKKKGGLFHGRKETWLSFCPKIEGVEPLSKFPALLEEADPDRGRVQGWEYGLENPPQLLRVGEGLQEGCERQERIPDAGIASSRSGGATERRKKGIFPLGMSQGRGVADISPRTSQSCDPRGSSASPWDIWGMLG